VSSDTHNETDLNIWSESCILHLLVSLPFWSCWFISKQKSTRTSPSGIQTDED